MKIIIDDPKHIRVPRVLFMFTRFSCVGVGPQLEFACLRRRNPLEIEYAWRINIRCGWVWYRDVRKLHWHWFMRVIPAWSDEPSAYRHYMEETGKWAVRMPPKDEDKSVVSLLGHECLACDFGKYSVSSADPDKAYCYSCGHKANLAYSREAIELALDVKQSALEIEAQARAAEDAWINT